MTWLQLTFATTSDNADLISEGLTDAGAQAVTTRNNEQALIATQENARRNGVSEQIETFFPETMPSITADMLVANILSEPLIKLVPVFADTLSADGRIVLSGILANQAGEIVRAYELWFNMRPAVSSNEWVRLEGIRLPVKQTDDV